MIKIQYIVKEDLQEIRDLFIIEFNKEPWNDKWEESRAYHRLNDLYQHPRFVGLVCVLEERIVGVAMGYLEYWYEGYHYNLKEIFIDTTVQGKGIGSKLLSALEEDLKDRDVRSIELMTLNAQKTLKFYEKNKYEISSSLLMLKKNINE